jgi:hypothetical protein
LRVAKGLGDAFLKVGVHGKWSDGVME